MPRTGHDKTKRNGRWRVRWRDHTGKRRSKTFERESQADSFLARTRVERDDVRSGRKATATDLAKRAPFMADYLKDVFIPALDVPGDYKLAERVTSKGILKNHIAPYFGGKRLDEIDKSSGAAFRAALAAKKLKPKTVHNIMLLLTRVLRHAEDNDVIARAPAFKPSKQARIQRRELAGPIDRENYLDFEEYNRLTAACASDPLLLAMVLVAGRAGLRSGELRALRWCDVDFGRGVITVRLSNYRGNLDTPKSGVGREIPMGVRVKEALEALGIGKGTAPIFDVSERGSTLRLIAAGAQAGLPAAVAQRERMRECRRAYKIRKAGKEPTAAQADRVKAYDEGEAVGFGWHTLRHSFCSHLAMSGTSVVEIMEWAGHANLATSQRYMHLAPGKRTPASIDRLDGIVHLRAVP